MLYIASSKEMGLWLLVRHPRLEKGGAGPGGNRHSIEDGIALRSASVAARQLMHGKRAVSVGLRIPTISCF